MKKNLQINAALANATYMVCMIEEGKWFPELQHFDLHVEDWDGTCAPFLIGYDGNRTVIIKPVNWTYRIYRKT